MLHSSVAVYPSADPAGTPAELGAGWLVVLESATPAEPLAGDAGKLLDNMLRAMRLHRHPRTLVATLERPQPGSSAAAGAEPAAALAHTLATARPAMVLLLGLGAARAVLGSREPLGRLRAGVHQITAPDGTAVPAVVSYDPAYLLRAPDAKAAAWADLCRALALVRSAAGTA
ncbi:uracil-DNA glycosylase family protein [Paracidovorax wautersii]|uniref:uracil-DNA glycosylase family protein n=1 Tax=Paracidovorax wautersii TaxID=1177982 RepID=UPI00286C1873|nr:uracil-DNA glycosylase family protein [Paracidovorax wautersii]